MSPSPLRSYRVCLHEWDVYELFVDAIDEPDALRQAKAVYRESGRAGFDHFTAGDDGFTVEADGTEVGA